MGVRVKICCISSEAELRMAVAAGAHALGLVGPMPSGPGVLDDVRIRTLADAAPPAVSTFLLTSQTAAGEVVAHHRRVATNAIQLVDALPEGAHADIRKALPGIKLIQVIHMRGEVSMAEAENAWSQADALLLDSGNPDLKVKELGGTGRTHNWEISRRICAESPVPVFLAGGLNAGNVREAIEFVKPYGVDICSGVRTDGRLDPEKLRAFMAAVAAGPSAEGQIR